MCGEWGVGSGGGVTHFTPAAAALNAADKTNDNSVCLPRASPQALMEEARRSCVITHKLYVSRVHRGPIGVCFNLNRLDLI